MKQALFLLAGKGDKMETYSDAQKKRIKEVEKAAVEHRERMLKGFGPAWPGSKGSTIRSEGQEKRLKVSREVKGQRVVYRGGERIE